MIRSETLLDPDQIRLPTIEDIDAVREAYNLSKNEFSERAGFARDRWSRILRDDEDPSLSTIRAFLEVLRDADPDGPRAQPGRDTACNIRTDGGADQDATRLDIQAWRTAAGELDVSLTERSAEVLEAACRRRAEWSSGHGYDEARYRFEDLGFLITSDSPVTVSLVEVARLADAASWLAAVATDEQFGDDAADLTSHLWALVDEDGGSR